MDLTQINDEVYQRELTWRMCPRLHETYDAVLMQAVPLRLQELLRRLDSLADEPAKKLTSR